MGWRSLVNACAYMCVLDTATQACSLLFMNLIPILWGTTIRKREWGALRTKPIKLVRMANGRVENLFGVSDYQENWLPRQVA